MQHTQYIIQYTEYSVDIHHTSYSIHHIIRHTSDNTYHEVGSIQHT